jgi:DNA processing protein
MTQGPDSALAQEVAPPAMVLRCDDPGYPARLRALEMAPAQLHQRGAWDERLPALAIVGARAASGAAQRLAHGLAEVAVRAGYGVVSGGAIGIDAAAHRGALAARGRTCVVLGTGIDVAYPQRHGSLFIEVLQRGGCLLSSFPDGTPPKPWHFPARNRFIAALSDAVLVVEASGQSGSRSTAEAALHLGRPVLCVPGSPGTDALLAGGALPVQGETELLLRLREPTARPARALALPFEEPDEDGDPPAFESMNDVRAALDQVPRDLSELSLRAGLPPAACAAAVLNLELRGACLRLAGGRFIARDQH